MTEVRPKARRSTTSSWRHTTKLEILGRRSFEPKIGDGQTSFFLTKFPDSYKAKEISQGYGKVSGVYIPAKRDKKGEKLGFVIYVDVRDRRSLELQLDKIFLGDKRLTINTPMFQRERRKEMVRVSYKDNVSRDRRPQELPRH